MSKQFSYTLDKNASKVHKEIVNFFKKNMPGFNLSQNHAIKIDDQVLYADIYITTPIKIIIEIQGEQHYHFVKYFHKTLDNFRKYQMNDKLKREWAEMNSFNYITIDVKNFDISNFNNFLMEKLK